MTDIKRIGMAGGTLACIGAIGFFMQSGANAPQGRVTVAQAGMASAVAPGVNGVQTPVDISEISLTSADVETPQAPAAPDTAADPAPDIAAQSDAPVAQPQDAVQPVKLTLLDDAPANPEAAASPMKAPESAESCDIAMSGTEIAGALVKLSLEAPCLPNERLTMHHNGMMFTETTDDAGALDVVVPALAENAVFIASFSNSEGAVANVKMTTLDMFDRAVVQAEAFGSVGLHALEYGAGYEDAGHIWADAAGDIADAALGQGGFLLQLGNPDVTGATVAQVYTFPTGLAEQSGDVELSVEIEVTSMNCGHEIEAQALQVHAGSQPKVQTLDLTMPDCDAVGDFLVLKNLVNDLKVAANTH